MDRLWQHHAFFTRDDLRLNLTSLNSKLSYTYTTHCHPYDSGRTHATKQHHLHLAPERLAQIRYARVSYSELCCWLDRQQSCRRKSSASRQADGTARRPGPREAAHDRLPRPGRESGRSESVLLSRQAPEHRLQESAAASV